MGVKMAIHPDDPPWGIFGLPRIITTQKNLERFLNMIPSVNNGVTFCIGSFGADPNNDLISMINTAKGRIHFAHLRNIKYTGERSFQESAHPTECGSLDMFGIVKALVDSGFDGLCPPRPRQNDMGRNGQVRLRPVRQGLSAPCISTGSSRPCRK